jgi:ribonuclease-3
LKNDSPIRACCRDRFAFEPDLTAIRRQQSRDSGNERGLAAAGKSDDHEIEEALEHPVDYKSVLQERLARRAAVVTYQTVAEEGPAHDRSFIAVAQVDGQELGRGEGKTKKGAEQEAALQALDSLDLGSEP